MDFDLYNSSTLYKLNWNFEGYQVSYSISKQLKVMARNYQDTETKAYVIYRGKKLASKYLNLKKIQEKEEEIKRSTVDEL